MVSEKHNDLQKAREEFFQDCELTACSPGSYFWSGEHAVMYGQLAILHPVNLYAYVGIENNSHGKFEFEVLGIKREINVISENLSPENMEIITHQWDERVRIEKFLEFWREQNNQAYFKIKVWFEVPPKCGLNSSGGIAAALAGLLQVLETRQSDRQVLIEQINSWHNKPIEELKENPVFDAIFRRAWMLDDCSHNFSSSGAGPFSSLVGSPHGNLLLYFAQNKGFNSSHPLKRLDKSDIEIISEDFKQAEKKLSRIEWWGKRFTLKENLKKKVRTAVIYCGVPKNTDHVLSGLDEKYKIPVEAFKSLFSRIFPEEAFKLKQVARPISDFIKQYNQNPVQSELYIKSLFNESLGLTSCMLLDILDRDNLAELCQHITTINKFLDFYGVFTSKLVELCNFIIKKNPDAKAGIKLTGAGDGGDLVAIGSKNSIDGIVSSVKDNYCIHYTTGTGWEAEGLTVQIASRKKIAIVVPEQDIIQNTMEIGFKKGEPYILINQKPPTKHFEEWLFAPLLVIAAYRKKDKKVNKETDLFLLKVRRREQLLTEIRQFLMTATFKTNVDRKDILRSDGSGNIDIEVFEKDFIIIDRSIRNFESRHMVPAEEAIDEIRRLLKAKKQVSSDQADIEEADYAQARHANIIRKEIKQSYRRLKREARLTFKHTRLVRKAIQVIGWKFQNDTWMQRWDDLVSKCHVLCENFKYLDDTVDDMDEELYFHLPQRGRQ